MNIQEHLFNELREFYQKLPKQTEHIKPPSPPQITSTTRIFTPETLPPEVKHFLQKPADPESPSNAIPV